MERMAVERMLSEIQSIHPGVPQSRKHAQLVMVLSRDGVDEGDARAFLSSCLADGQKWPTPTQLVGVLRNRQGDKFKIEQQAIIREVVAKFGHDFLAMDSLPARSPCVSCTWRPQPNAPSWWEAVGGSHQDRLLKHVHWWNADAIEAEFGMRPRWDVEIQEITIGTLVVAGEWCRRHAPDGTKIDFPFEYHPLRTHLPPSEFLALSREWSSRYMLEVKERYPLNLEQMTKTMTLPQKAMEVLA